MMTLTQPTTRTNPSTATASRHLVVTGATGLIGSALVAHLAGGATQITTLRHHEPFTPGPLLGADAVVHLAGESIASGRWTTEKKRAIRDSRVQRTRQLAERLGSMTRPPRTFVVASAIGYYGNRADETLTERSASGNGFLAEVCRAWEAAAEPARRAGIRVINLRFGMVLSANGGALAKLLTPFRLGAGGIIGTGRQWMSWITLADTVRAIAFALDHDDLSGPVNVVSPQPLTNDDFTKTLGRVLRRPTILPLPTFAVRGIFGEMGRELLLASTRVEPQRLRQAGFTFNHPTLAVGLRAILDPHQGDTTV